MIIEVVGTDMKVKMETFNNSMVPFPVVSIDHTHNVQGRTSVHSPGPPPEQRSFRQPILARHVPSAKNALLTVMGANCQVTSITEPLLLLYSQ